jgi:TrmH family RNA methyltransferase
MTIITSRDNQKLKFARAVRDGREPAYIFIEGARLAGEAVRSGAEIVDVLISETFETKTADRDALRGLDNGNILPLVVADRHFASIADTKSPQGIVVIAKRPQASLDRIEQAIDANNSGIPVVIFLSEINNPSNLGAIFRTAEAAGAAGLIISPNSADVFSTKAIRSAMGANLRLAACENISIEEAIAWAGGKNLVPTAADKNGNVGYTQIDWKLPRLLIFGSEAHGLNDVERERVDEIINIPMESEVESLNLAVSCGIILFEARRQQASA